MSRRTAYWIILTAPHVSEIYVSDWSTRRCEIAPQTRLKKGDQVYLWSNVNQCFYAWGEIIETPQTIVQEQIRPDNYIEKKERMLVLVKTTDFKPAMFGEMMKQDKNLKRLVPEGYDDLYAIPLRPGQASYLNDFGRLQGSDVPTESETVEVRVQEPQFLIKTLLDFGDKTDEGQLIKAVTIPWFDIIELLLKDPSEAFQISDRQWEEIIAGAYVRAGWDDVTLTPRSGDYGRDVIAVKKGTGIVRVIEQVKAFGPNRLVTADDVRSLMGVLQTDGASKGFLTTTSKFAPLLRFDPLIQPLIPQRLELINGDKLIQRLAELRRK
jgi:restriction system protein